MELEVWGQTDVGLKRSNNQDSFLIDEEHQLFIVADGMGGHSGGEIASAMAVAGVQETVVAAFKGNRRIYPRELMTKAYRTANDRIYQKSNEENSRFHGMGTTMVTLFFYRDTAYVTNVGDSRCYLFSAPHLWRITEDHSVINEHLRAGLLKESDAANFTAKNIITRSVGFEVDVNCDIFERAVRPNESFLLCSDGFSGLVPEKRIIDLFFSVPRSELVSRCIYEAKKAGGDDNVTVILVHTKA